MNARAELGSIIRLMREALGLNQAELAAKFGLSQSQISRWEAGTCAPDLFQWDQLKQLFAQKREEQPCPRCLAVASEWSAGASNQP